MLRILSQTIKVKAFAPLTPARSTFSTTSIIRTMSVANLKDLKTTVNPSLVLKQAHEIVFEDRPIPTLPDPHYVKLNIKKTGICGSDVHYFTHGSIGNFIVKDPMVLGHESAGIVTEVGSAVTSLKVGDKVAIEPGIPSRYSDEYKVGKYNLCPHMAFAATPPYDGTLARYYTVPEDFCVKLPENVSLEEGAMAEPLSVAVHVTRLGGVTFGSKVIVFGAGPIGLLAIATAKAYGATDIIAVDIIPSKLEVAKEMGATHTFIPSKDDSSEVSAEKIQKQVGFAPDICIEASGAQPSIQTAVHVLAPAGVLVQAGQGRDYVNFPITMVSIKELVLKGSFRYFYGDYKIAVGLIAEGKVNVKRMITHRVKFGDAVQAFELVRDGKAIKCIIDGPEDE